MTSSLSRRPEELGQSVLVSPRSCLACSKRKVRCSRSHTCLNCIERGIACIYPANTKRRPRGPGKKKTVTTKDGDMRRRVSKLENLLEHLSDHLVRGQTLSVEENCDKMHTLANAESYSRIGRTNFAEERSGGSNQDVRLHGIRKEHPGFNPQDLTWLVENNGRNLYISNTFWASMSDEIEDLHDVLDCQSEDSSRSIGETECVSSVARDHNFLFGIRGNLESIQTLLLPPSQIQICGRVFLRNVHPLFPILHSQQIEGILQKAAYQSINLNKSEVAQLAVVSFAAVASMPVEDIEMEFGEPKPAVLEHHQHVVEHALTEAELMSTIDLGTLQAFVLFIICLRRSDNARHIWMLVGLALRIALALGIHRDGENFDLPPFQTEMRRRLWWQIYVLEIRAAEDQGCNSTVNRDSFDTQLPLNINDEDIKVDATSAPIPRSGFTDMTFGIIRYETVLLSYAVQPGRLAFFRIPEEFTAADKLRQITACEEKLQMDYLQFVSTEEPRAIIANVLARTAIAKMKLAVQSPFHWHLSEADTSKMPEHTPLAEEINERLFLLSISVLEDSIFLSTEPSIKQWAWASKKYIHWHPLIIILTDLCHRPLSNHAGRAWKAVDGVLQSGNIQGNSTICDRDAVLWRPIMRLMEKARRNSRASRKPVIDAVAAEMSSMGDNGTVENAIEADNTEAGEHISGDTNLLDYPATLSTSSLDDEILPQFVSSAEFNQYTGVAYENYPQNMWDSSTNQFSFDMLGDESTYFQGQIFRNTCDWW